MILADLHRAGETPWLKGKCVILSLVKLKISGLHLRILVGALVGQEAALFNYFFV